MKPRSRLIGWKAIGAWLGRDARTAKRWEVDRGLPVRRTPGGRRPSVWADAAELQAWLEGRGRALQRTAPSRPRRAGGHARPPDRDGYADQPEARDAYLEAQYAASRRTPAALAFAAAAYAALAARFPDRSEALAGLAECHLLAREFAMAPEAAAYAAARSCAARARALAPDSADALRALGFVAFWWDADVDRGLAWLRKAAALAPHSARARHWLATALGARGEFAAARIEIDAARRLDPRSTSALADRSMLRFAAGERAEGRAGLERLAQMAPEFSATHAYLAQMDLLEGRDAEFPGRIETEGRLRGDPAAVELGRRLAQVLAAGGAIAMRRAFAAAQEAQHRGDGLSALHVARAWAAAGERGAALDWLDVCRERREPGLVAAHGDFVLRAALHGRPRFEAFRQAV
jgi:tetratricopeptide (TPR) repeat protein